MVSVAVLGGGVVGYGVAQMICENQAHLRRCTGEEVAVKYILDIRDIEPPVGATLTHSFDDILNDSDIRIVAETIGGTGAAYDYTRRALMSGRHVVTSNKELVATHGDELSRIAEDHQVSYLFEASTGGGIPLLHPIMRCLSVNEITRIDGIVNGSTNYLLTKMRDEGIDFETALANAKALGYVEADPSADVNGLDAQRKASILAACAFGSRFDSGKDLPVKGIGDILADDHTAAAAFGGSIKLIAHLQLLSEQNTWTGWVHPCLVKAGHPLYSVNDVFNGIIVHGNYVDDVMFYGRGAGRRPTASAVVSDIAEIVKNIDASIMTNRCASACQPAFSRLDLPIARLFRTDTASAIVLERQNPAWHVKPLAHEAAIVTDALTQETFDHLTAGMRISEPIWVLEQT